MQRLWVSPIQRLDEAAQQVAVGDLQTTVESSSDEIGRLAGSFNQMVDKIRDVLEETQSKKQKAHEAEEEAARLAERSQEVTAFPRSEIEDLSGRIERLKDGDLTVSFVGGGSGSTLMAICHIAGSGSRLSRWPDPRGRCFPPAFLSGRRRVVIF